MSMYALRVEDFRGILTKVIHEYVLTTRVIEQEGGDVMYEPFNYHPGISLCVMLANIVHVKPFKGNSGCALLLLRGGAGHCRGKREKEGREARVGCLGSGECCGRVSSAEVWVPG